MKTSFQSRPSLFTALQAQVGSKGKQSEVCNSRRSNNGTTASCITEIDMWILFSLADSTRLKSKVISLIATKFSEESLTRSIIADSMQGFADTLDPIFPSILNLAGLSVQLSNWTLVSSSRELAAVLQEFSSPSHRQEIVVALVTHASSPVEAEVNLSLGILNKIAELEVDNARGTRLQTRYALPWDGTSTSLYSTGDSVDGAPPPN